MTEQLALCTCGAPGKTLHLTFASTTLSYFLRKGHTHPPNRVSLIVPKPGLTWFAGHCSKSGCYLPVKQDTVGGTHQESEVSKGIC